MGNIVKCKRKPVDDKENVPPVAFRTVTPNHLLPDDLNPFEHPNRKYASNSIKTAKYTMLTFLPKNLFEQFHRFANVYFVFIVCLNWVPVVNAFAKELAMIPLLFVLAITAVKDGVEDYRRYRSDKKVNEMSCRVFSRKEDRYVRNQWSNIKVGDFVHLSCNEIIPADILLLRSSDDQGLCYVETANLDGENNLKQREAVKGLEYKDHEFKPVKFRGQIECDLPNTEMYKFNGTINQPGGKHLSISKTNLILRECVIRNTDFIEGIVLYAGHETKALLNNHGTRYKRSKLEKQINKDVLWCVVILLFLCLFSAIGSAIWESNWPDIPDTIFIPFAVKCRSIPWCQGLVVFWTYIIIFQVLIPLPLYVTIELVKLGQIYFIQNDIELFDATTNKPVICRAWNITEDLGQIQYVFCDKTGTLTENKMVFKKCTIGGINYSHSEQGGASVQGATSHPVTEDSQLDENLHRQVATMSLRCHDAAENSTPAMVQSQRSQDFFILLAVCNTVFVSSHLHVDQMNESGDILEDDAKPTEEDDTAASYVKRLRYKVKNKNKSLNYKNLTEDSECSPPLTESVESSNISISMLSENSLQSRYEAESPDELALVKAACRYGCQLIKRSPDCVSIWLPAEGELDFQILHVLHFDSTRQRMSIIVKHPLTGEIILYCKGSDIAIFENLAEPIDGDNSRVLKETQSHLTLYAEQGLRTLCMAKRVLSQTVYNDWLAHWQKAHQAVENREDLLQNCAIRIEKEMELLGVTGIEDCLQEDVPHTIAALREAGMKVWMITGDKEETAMNIAFSCKLLSFGQQILKLNSENKEDTESLLDQLTDQIEQTSSTSDSRLAPKMALVVTGRALQHVLKEKVMKNKLKNLVAQCNSVICCRTTPKQKAAVVKLVKEKLSKVTLAIGDGANDVNMIQAADVGVGVSGKEGIQAAMAADFCIARFKLLKRLLLVHGHWSYDRLARMALYSFYKNSVFIFLLFWYQFYNGFSGSVMIDQYYLLLYSACFSALPPIILGIFDQDLTAETLLLKPHLYKQGPACMVYFPHSYWVCTIDALWQSLAMFFVPFIAYAGSSVGIWQFGTVCMAGCMLTTLVHIAIETKSWTWLHWFGVGISFIVFIVFGLVFNLLCVSCGKPSDPYMVMEQSIVDPKFWFCVFSQCVVALMPRLATRAISSTIWPSDVLKARQCEKLGNRLEESGEGLVHQEVHATYSSSDSSVEFKGSINGIQKKKKRKKLVNPTA